MIDTNTISIDEITARDIMRYYKIDNHDEFVRFIKSMGVEHYD